MRTGFLAFLVSALIGVVAVGELAQPPVTATLGGETGVRAMRIVENWVFPAPDANPGMLEMFRLRDRNPAYEEPVPWAGEFAGKYLTSAVLLARMDADPALREHIARFVEELISTQSPEGYFGPFREDERLLGNWDLWGHYHVMLGLWTWYHDTRDQAALDAALKAANFMCTVYLDGDRRVHDAGSQEMNMAVIHVLGILYRETQEPRYLALMRQIEEDFAKPPAGDYLRTGVEGVPFYETPKPRWESLHPMEGLAELYRITGEDQYRDALLHHWHSIAELDIHNSGSFSTNEGAVGNPFMPGAIETCCTVAWIAYSIDALRIAADPVIADYLERATWNAVLAYQHPSGRWCTYDTPMDGKRQASAHSIVFQSRPGTPELNCCSVNGPRGLGMITDWAVLGGADGLYLNYYGPGTFTVNVNGEAWTFVQDTAYPVKGEVRITVHPPRETEMPLHLRIPSWSDVTSVRVNGDDVEAEPGAYLALGHTWKAGDVITLDLDMSLRALRGDEHVDGKTSLFRGPLLLAYDQKYNTVEPGNLPTLDLDKLQLTAIDPGAVRHPPIALFAASDGAHTLNLCDFASAGAHGTAYRSWLPIGNAPPARAFLVRPRNGDVIHAADASAVLLWSDVAENAEYQVRVTRDGETVLDETVTEPRLFVDDLFGKSGDFTWTVTVITEQGEALSSAPANFRVEREASPPHRYLLNATLLKQDESRPGAVLEAEGLGTAAGPGGAPGTALAFDGTTSKLVYSLAGRPSESYSAMAWFRAEPKQPDTGTWHQILCCWEKPMVDPLRISVMDGALQVRIEQPAGACGLRGPNVADGEWHHVAVVKDGTELRLYLDGIYRQRVNAPESVASEAAILGVGCNPRHTTLEGFRGDIASVQLLEGALTDGAIYKAARKGG